MKLSRHATLGVALAGAMLANAASAITSGPGEATLNVDNHWGEGYCASVTVANNGSAAITSWTVDLDFNGSVVNNLWNGNLSGNKVYTEVYHANGRTDGGSRFCVDRNCT